MTSWNNQLLQQKINKVAVQIPNNLQTTSKVASSLIASKVINNPMIQQPTNNLLKTYHTMVKAWSCQMTSNKKKWTANKTRKLKKRKTTIDQVLILILTSLITRSFLLVIYVSCVNFFVTSDVTAIASEVAVKDFLELNANWLPPFNFVNQL